MSPFDPPATSRLPTETDDVGTAGDVVETTADAAAASRPPLIVLEPLRAFLDERGIGSGSPVVAAIGDGHSNVTYRVTRGDATVVVRRPPRPPIPPSTHDVVREAKIVRALAGADVPVPRILAICEEPEVIGAPFVVMEHVDGYVATDDLPVALDNPTERSRVGLELVRVLAGLHAIDWTQLDLDAPRRPTGYLERQLRRFAGLWDLNKTRDLPAIDRVCSWLLGNLPRSEEPTIVHGDYRLGNAMLGRAAPAEIVSVLDWEMATIGEPRADLGYLIALWSEPGDPEPEYHDLSPVTRRPGFPSRAELRQTYCSESGRDLPDIRWFVTLALWKAAIFMEGNYRRAIGGASDDPYLLSFEGGVVDLAERALRCGPGGEEL